jgi:hypothetical protein
MAATNGDEDKTTGYPEDEGSEPKAICSPTGPTLPASTERGGHPTGVAQAAENRENDPPA